MKARVRLPGGFVPPRAGLHQWLACLVLAAALWLLGAAWLGLGALRAALADWRNEALLHVYLPQARADALPALQRALKLEAGAGVVRTIPPEEAAREAVRLAGAPGIPVAELAVTMPITILVRAPAAPDGDWFALLEKTARAHGARVNADELALARWHVRLALLERGLAWAGAGIVLALAVVIANTLRMLVLAQRDEIELLRLFGAAEWFVRMPFLVEGAWLGALAGLLAWVLLALARAALADAVPALAAVPLARPGLVLVAAGVAAGTVGALLATIGEREEAV